MSQSQIPVIRFLPVEWHEVLPSTNSYLTERVKRDPGTPHGTVVAAREQTAGRGRQQRRWQAPPNENITVSFLWNAPVAAGIVPSMAQAISVGICHALASHVEPAIKWPNDIQVGGKKIAGILCERVEPGGSGHVAIVAGIGLNVNMSREYADAIDQPATSLALEAGEAFDTEVVLAHLLEAIESPLDAWSRGGFAAIREAYTRYGAGPGTLLQVRDGDQRHTGRVEGYDGHGALVLRLESGALRTFYSGDVSAGLGMMGC